MNNTLITSGESLLSLFIPNMERYSVLPKALMTAPFMSQFYSYHESILYHRCLDWIFDSIKLFPFFSLLGYLLKI